MLGRGLRTVIDGLDHPEGVCWCPPSEHLLYAGGEAGQVSRLSPEGRLETIVDDWTGEYVLMPTNLAFAGDDLEVLVLASLGGQAVKAIDPGVRGAALQYPELPAP